MRGGLGRVRLGVGVVGGVSGQRIERVKVKTTKIKKTKKIIAQIIKQKKITEKTI